MSAIQLRDYLNQSRAAEILNRNRTTIWRWMKEGKITYVLIGDMRMIPRSEVERVAAESSKEVAKEWHPAVT